jgi:hypothetical protein
MGQVLHGSAETTHAIRGKLQRSQAPVAQLAQRYGINAVWWAETTGVDGACLVSEC